MASLAEGEKKSLLHVARGALTAAAERRSFTGDVLPEGSLVRPGGAFVTLFRGGRLRGCIGQLPSQASLVDVVESCAKAVASEDPRFPRVTAEELAGIEIEISVLSGLKDTKPEEIEIGKHGLFVSNGLRRGVLLPQVATQFHWNPTRFLQATCEKAGLTSDAWRNPATQVQSFMAEVFSEAEFRNQSPSRLT